MKKYCLIILVFLSTVSFGQSWDWVKPEINNNSSSFSDPEDLTIDRYGNIFETGAFWGSNNYGSINVTTPITTYDAFLIKFDNSGNPLWAVAPIVTSLGYAMDIATSKSGNVCIAGIYKGNMSIGAFNFPYANLNTYGSLFTAMFSSSGSLIWAISSTETDTIKDYIDPYSIAIDDSGNTYITGMFEDTVSINAVHIYSPNCISFFLLKLDNAGNIIWVKSAKPNSTTMGDYGNTVVTDSLGNVYVAGTFSDSLTLGSNTITTKGISDVFLVKYNSSGNVLWATSALLPDSSSSSYFRNNHGRFLSIDNAGDLYLTGLFFDTVKFGTQNLNSKYGGIFLTKYSSSGNAIWARMNTDLKSFTSEEFQPYSISCDKNGYIYTCGTYQDSIEFNSIKLISDSTYPSYLFEFDSAGNAICGTGIDNLNDDNNCVAADPINNDVFFSGDVETTNPNDSEGCYFGSYYLSGIGEEYAFLAKWKCNTGEGINNILTNKVATSLFPNPNNGLFTLACHSEESHSMLSIYNMLGEKMLTEILRSSQGDNTINISNQSNGIYLYRVMDKSGELLGSGKFIIQK